MRMTIYTFNEDMYFQNNKVKAKMVKNGHKIIYIYFFV